MRESHRIIMTIALCFVFSAFFSIAVFAEEDKPAVVDEEMVTAIDLVQLENDDLIEMVEKSGSLDKVIASGSVADLEAYYASQLKDMGELELTSSFTRESITTFSESKSIEGFGKEGVLVGMYVFHFESEISPVGDTVESIVVTQDTISEIGASEIYSETITFDYVGENYVVLISLDEETDTEVVRLFKVCRKEVVTRDLLENVEINFFEEEESPKIQELVPKLTDFGF